MSRKSTSQASPSSHSAAGIGLRAQALGVPIDEQHLVPVADELRRDRPPHLPGPGDDDAHQCSSGCGGLPSTASTTSTSCSRSSTWTRSPSCTTVSARGSIPLPRRVMIATRHGACSSRSGQAGDRPSPRRRAPRRAGSTRWDPSTRPPPRKAAADAASGPRSTARSPRSGSPAAGRPRRAWGRRCGRRRSRCRRSRGRRGPRGCWSCRRRTRRRRPSPPGCPASARISRSKPTPVIVRPRKSGGSRRKRAGLVVDHGHRVPHGVEVAGERGTHAAAAHDHDMHGCEPPTSTCLRGPGSHDYPCASWSTRRTSPSDSSSAAPSTATSWARRSSPSGWLSRSSRATPCRRWPTPPRRSSSSWRWRARRG